MLYLVATPIGNLEDISLRALNTLRSVDLIAAEDTRHTSKLLMHFDIKKPLVSYHEHNKDSLGEVLIGKLKNGESIAYVTDAGTPGISDPGEDLVKLAIENGIEYTLIPGPCALIMGAVLSGFNTRSFVFEGFLPQDKKKRKEVLERISNEKRTLVFYAPPHHILSTLKEMKEYVGDRQICLARELTKKFEELKWGSVDSLIEFYEENNPRGEFVIVIEGAREVEQVNEYEDDEIFKMVNDKIEKGHKRNNAIKEVAKETNLSRNDVYAIYEKKKGTIL
ncbi:MAG: 16S rRNA (cytidine(1402)-2'-O)-methyltransferase [Clostridiaceae bacterium]|nr:16S rRNA (cytidine(1402)-2'-O)-methyltransferase [Clostridiaceae bacterium]